MTPCERVDPKGMHGAVLEEGFVYLIIDEGHASGSLKTEGSGLRVNFKGEQPANMDGATQRSLGSIHSGIGCCLACPRS